MSIDRPPITIHTGLRTTVHIRGRAIQLPLVLWLLAVWILMYGDVTVLIVLGGLLVSVLIVVAFPLPIADPGLRLRPWGTLRFVVLFGYDLIVASLRVVAQSFAFGWTPHSSVIAVSLRTRSDLLLTATGSMLSVVPGTLTVEVRHSTATLFVHVLGASDDAAIRSARAEIWKTEELLTRAFGTRNDIRHLDEEPAREEGA